MYHINVQPNLYPSGEDSYVESEYFILTLCHICCNILGWEPTLSVHSTQTQSQRTNRHQGRHKVGSHGRGGPSPSIDYKFNHCEDISQYMRDYRAYHTYRHTGALTSAYSYDHRNRPFFNTGLIEKFLLADEMK